MIKLCLNANKLEKCKQSQGKTAEIDWVSINSSVTKCTTRYELKHCVGQRVETLARLLAVTETLEYGDISHGGNL